MVLCAWVCVWLELESLGRVLKGWSSSDAVFSLVYLFLKNTNVCGYLCRKVFEEMVGGNGWIWAGFSYV
jgi:hypothetical protein